MIIRQAFFEGRFLEGREAEFKAYVDEKLLPLWRQFPGAREVRVLYEAERDEGSAPFAMVLAIVYDDLAAVEAALASPVRYESREATKGLNAFFEGTIHHHVFEISADLRP